MKKIYFLLPAIALCLSARSQNPGLVISEILANPNSTDSCKEYVELLATQNINFSLTPYTIVVNNNGNATAQGWIAGGTLSYAFEVSAGSVTAGDVVYVGGSCMAPTGNKLRTIDVKYFGGDGGIGSAMSGGVFGNGGGNADGVAIFNLPVASITSSSVPTEAYFYGTGVGSASVTGGTAGYQLPVNDLYSGGKFGTGNYFGPDPGADDIIQLTGVFNTNSNMWLSPRTYSLTQTMTNGISSVSLSTVAIVPATIAFLSADTTVSEGSATANIYLRLTSTSAASSAISVSVSALSNATAADYTLGVLTVTFAGNAPVNTAAVITVSLNNDAIAESAEYIVLKLSNPQNANPGSTSQCIVYIADNDKPIPAPSNAISLNFLSTFTNGVSGSNSAEIVTHDPTTQRLYIANSIGGKLDIVNFINPSNPVLLASLPITTYGNINSVAVKNGIVAAAIENGSNPQDSGKVVFFDKDGIFLKQVTVGMMPDMITFNHAGTKVLTANEGEPNNTYTNDPDGSISIVDISGGIASLTQTNVAHVTFTAYNGQEATLRSQGIRIYGPGASASKDFEPEYISVSKDDAKAWVSLQENNALVEINLTNNTINYIKALGTKDHMQLNNGIDASNVTKGINIANLPVKGFYLPDAIASYTVGGVNYVVSANEGDARAYAGFSEEQRISGANIDAAKFPHAAEMKNTSFLGRLNITNKSGDIDNDGDLDTLYSYGSRSFSIWNANTGNLVYDSKDDLELITSTNSYSVLFNASNSNNNRKDRSDDKGPEPEGVTIGTIGANTYAFIALERIGGVIVYDISDPNAPVYVTYVNNRSLPGLGPDLGSEGIIFIPQSESPNGQHLVVVANEVSSSLSIWGIPGCTTPISSSLSVSGSTANSCSSNPAMISVPSATNLSYQWSRNGTAIPGASLNSVAASVSGNYSVAISGGSVCAASSLSQSITVLPSPTLAVSGNTYVCAGNPVTLTVSGANTYTWNTGANGTTVIVSPTVTSTYTVTGTMGTCTGSATRSITVNPGPVISVNSGSICFGQSFTITASGASTYTYSGGPVVNPTVNTTYSVTGTSTAGCISTTAAIAGVSVNPLPVISVNSGAICNGNTFTINPSGASSYTISGGTATVSPVSTTIYSVSGTNSLGCISASASISTVTVNQPPVISVNNGSICKGQNFQITASGASTYTYSGGTSVVSPSVSTSYSVTGTSGAGCVSTVAAVSNVTVVSLPVISISGAGSPVCQNTPLSLTASGANSYTWNTLATTASINITPIVTSTYIVNGSSNGCSNFAVKVVTVNSLPAVSITAANNVICNGQSTVLNASGANTYNWSNQATGITINVSPATNAVFTVTGTDQNGCTNTASTNITVNPLPTIGLTASSTMACTGEMVTISATGASTYSWDTGATGQILTVNPAQTTTYNVTAYSALNCSATANMVIEVAECASIVKTGAVVNNISIYPNPSNEIVTISGLGNNAAQVTIINAIGAIVYSENHYVHGKLLSIAGMHKGIYFVRITFGKETSIKKLVVE